MISPYMHGRLPNSDGLEKLDSAEDMRRLKPFFSRIASAWGDRKGFRRPTERDDSVLYLHLAGFNRRQYRVTSTWKWIVVGRDGDR